MKILDNKAKMVRTALGLTPTEAGCILFGHNPKQAYDTWSQWENGTKNPSAPTTAFFNAILLLSVARDLKTPGCDKALDLIINEFVRTQ